MFDYWWCFYLNSVSHFFCCSKLWSDLSDLNWSLVSEWYLEDRVLEDRVTTWYPTIFDENVFVPSFGTVVSYERHSASCFELRWSIYSCLFDFNCYCSNSSCYLNTWSYFVCNRFILLAKVPFNDSWCLWDIISDGLSMASDIFSAYYF